jgi:hypothetical protein
MGRVRDAMAPLEAEYATFVSRRQRQSYFQPYHVWDTFFLMDVGRERYGMGRGLNGYCGRNGEDIP